jgi:hypothetical protein
MLEAVPRWSLPDGSWAPNTPESMIIVQVRRPHPPLVSWAVVLLGVACGQISETGEDVGGSTSGGSGGRAGSAGDAGRAGSASAAGRGNGGSGGAVAPDAGAEAGAAGAGGSSGSAEQPVLPADCPTINPIPAAGQSIVVQSVNFTTSEIVLRNVSDAPVTILGDRTGWQWCNFPAYWAINEAGDVELSPGETFSFIAIYNTTGAREFDPEGGELGIYTATGSFTTADLMRAFVSWGDVIPQRESTASSAGLWAFGDRIEVEESSAGFVLVGEADRAAGYQAVRAACLAAPPNQ